MTRHIGVDDPYDLFDWSGGDPDHGIPATRIDALMSREHGFETLIDEILKSRTTRIVIVDDFPDCPNPAYHAFVDATLRGYRNAFEHNGIHCTIRHG